MNVLSLFDGMSCGQLALQRAGLDVDRYMASEIDKYGKQVTRKNFPNTIQLGDVCDVKGENLPPIDLLLGGSPCQGFSFAGKQLNFDDPRSALFFEYVRILKETKPKYFLLENVRMKQEYQDVISEHLGVKPVMICSSLVSAQSRKRLYWTNIPGLIQPKDKGIKLKHILEDDVDKEHYLTEVQKSKLDLDKPWASKDGTIIAKQAGKHQQDRIHHTDGKMGTLCGGTHGSTKHLTKIQVPITQPKDKGILLKDILEDGIGDIVTNQGKTTYKKNIDKSACLLARDYKGFGNQGMTGVRVVHRPCELKEFNENAECHHAATATDINGHDILKRVYADTGKSPTLNAHGGGNTEPKVLCGRIVGRKINPDTGKRDDYNPDLKTEQRLEPRLDEKSGTLTTVQKDNVLIAPEVLCGAWRGRSFDKDGNPTDWKSGEHKQVLETREDGKTNSITSVQKDNVVVTDMVFENPSATKKGKAYTLTHSYQGAVAWNSIERKQRTMVPVCQSDEDDPNVVDGYKYRKLTPVECMRLQTVDDDYFDDTGISNTQKFKLLGNGMTVDVIVHLLQGIKAEFIKQRIAA